MGAVILRDVSRLQRRRLVQALLRDRRRLTDVFAATLQALFGELGRRAEAAFLAIIPPTFHDAAGAMVLRDQPIPTDAEILDAMLRRMDLTAWEQKALIPAYDGHTLRTSRRTLGTINLHTGLGVSLPDYVMRDLVAQGGTRLGLVDIAGETRGSIFRALTDARTAGEHPWTAARRIRQQVPAGRFVNAGPTYRAKLIARTETMWAQNMSSISAYERSDVVTGMEAWDGQGTRPDPVCQARHGQTYGFAEARAEQEAEHPNGSLTFGPVTEPLQGRGR